MAGRRTRLIGGGLFLIRRKLASSLRRDHSGGLKRPPSARFWSWCCLPVCPPVCLAARQPAPMMIMGWLENKKGIDYGARAALAPIMFQKRAEKRE